jgi:cation diffusion facilitator CzcD-associated flavoprotein CzcO
MAGCIEDEPGRAGSGVTNTVGAASHDRRVAQDLDLLRLPPPPWTDAAIGPDGTAAFDVIVIGAGMYGIAATAALVMKGIRNVAMLDRAPEGQEGPWITYARMETLRSPKHLPGIALGIPSLTFRAWHEARFAAAAWEALVKIPNGLWQDYLTWVRTVLHLPLRSGVAVQRIVPGPGLVAVDAIEAGVERTLHARRVVLASGRAGMGFAVPDWVDPALWPDRAAHTAEAIDFGALRGRAVAVVGAGPSAWDNAATALEHGARRIDMIDMYVRRRELPQINKGRGSATPGFFEGWASLPAAEKWRVLVYLHDLQAPPPHETVLRTVRRAGFRIHLGTALHGAARSDDGVRLTLPDGGTAQADFLILGTGFGIDLRRSPELEAVAGAIANWADRYTPPAALQRPELGRFPWLGDGFELTERTPDACPGLARIHAFNHAAFASLGAIASDIPGVSTGAERLAHAIAAHFFTEDIAHVRRELETFAEPELQDTPFFVPERFPPI